jgi:THO complex subunit 4
MLPTNLSTMLRRLFENLMVPMLKVHLSTHPRNSLLTKPGQPIHLIPIPSGPSGGRRFPAPAPAPSRSLFDRITPRTRSESPIRHSDVSGPPPTNVDRYVPGRGSRSRSPRPRAPRRDGRRPGARRERGERNGGGGGGGGRGGERLAKDGRPRKTQEELDAEMEDYFGGSGGGGENGTTEVKEAKGDDIDMEEIL